MNEYLDIINIPRPESNHPKMSIEKRASIFNPFAALTGYEEAINEAGRVVDRKLELTEDQFKDLNTKLDYLKDKSNLEVAIIFFKKDKTKDGGKYEYIKGIYQKMNEVEGFIVIDRIKYLFTNLYQITIFN
ncbi:MAG: hypothetical protein K6G28_02270 [Acholeplasmatales bacterium]|nr:hypothetical protein [Acholeplasmatales bacterium]